MRFLVLGAGAVGGYFGGRMQQAGADVSFLVRPARYDRLKESGLVIRSKKGDATLKVAAVRTGEVRPDYDLVLLTCKAYDLDDAMEAIAPAVGASTSIVPILNGMRHLDSLQARFGAAAVLGGVARISATLGAGGEIVHHNPVAGLTAGERAAGQAPRPALVALGDVLGRAGIEGGLVANIVQDMWDKWIMLCSLAAMCCAMRGNVGEILASGEGEALMRETVAECQRVAMAEGHGPSEAALQGTLGMLTTRGSTFQASMLGDLERGGRIEADHVVGDMLVRARHAGLATPNLRFTFAALQAYESRRSLRGQR